MRKCVLSIIIGIALVCSMIMPVFSAATESINRYNVVIAMDASGSLQETDPNNYRLNAVNLFIQLLANEDNKLGCLSFSNDTLNQKELTSIKQTADKQAIYESLQTTAESETKKNGWTNIGSALQSAVNDIIYNGNRDIPSVILLLSDGNTELPTEKETQTSLDKKAEAVQTARENNISIYSLCLNANGKADKKEMEQISKATGGKSIEITKAEDLQNALTTFYSMIYGTAVETIVDNTFDSKGSVTVPFDVPGTGVEEINIIIYGKAKDVVISKPDKSAANYDEIEAESFSFLKVSDIVSGQWNVSLSGVPGDKVKIDLLFNTDLSVNTSISPDKSIFNPDDTITFEALVSGETGEASGELLDGYAATLQLRNNYGEITDEVPMNVENGSFIAETKLREGIYKYSVVVNGYNINKESEIKGPIRISTDVASKEQEDNTPPIPVNNPVNVKLNLWPFKENSYTLDVSKLATDNQEEPLEYRIESSSFIEGDDYTFDGTTLNMNDFSLSKGEFLINAYDKFGESCQITVIVSTRNIGLITVIMLAVVTLVLVAIVVIFISLARRKPFMGDITVTNVNSYQSSTQRKNRGNIKLSAFLIGDTGLNNKSFFQATGKNFIYFISKNPVECDCISGKTKKIKIENNFEIRIYSDSTHENGIEVRFNSFKD